MVLNDVATYSSAVLAILARPADPVRMKATRTRDPHSQDAPEKTSVPVPECCKGYDFPKDINKFSEDLYPNMRAYVNAKLPSYIGDGNRENRQRIIEDIINDHVIYMLATPKSGTRPRWRGYDPMYGGGGKQPYYKWYLVHLEFTRRGATRQWHDDRKKAALNLPILSDTEAESGNYGGAGIMMDKAVTEASRQFATGQLHVDPHNQLLIKEVMDFLHDLRRKADPKSWARLGPQIFQGYLEGLNTLGISRELNLTQKEARGSIKMFRLALKQYLERGYVDPRAQ